MRSVTGVLENFEPCETRAHRLRDVLRIGQRRYRIQRACRDQSRTFDLLKARQKVVAMRFVAEKLEGQIEVGNGAQGELGPHRISVVDGQALLLKIGNRLGTWILKK